MENRLSSYGIAEEFSQGFNQLKTGLFFCDVSNMYGFVSLQDIVGGRFDATQAFVGELSQFNIWDRVLRPVDIVGLANCSAYMPGNVVPWIDANVEVFDGASKAPLEICEDRAFDS